MKKKMKLRKMRRKPMNAYNPEPMIMGIITMKPICSSPDRAGRIKKSILVKKQIIEKMYHRCINMVHQFDVE